MYQIIKKQKIWLSITAVVMLCSLAFLAIWGLDPGIEFTGGSLLEVKFNADRPLNTDVQNAIKDLNLGGDVIVQATGEQNMLIRFQATEEDTHQLILNKLIETYPDNVQEERFEAIGPAIGQELKTKAFYSIILVIIAIILYVAWAFRKVSWPVKSWKYGVIAIIALVHDILVVLGLFAVLGRFWGVEVDLAFVAALLTILGYSVNDTIVIFDRIRENLGRLVKSDFDDIVNRSVNETITRSVNTALTTVLVLIVVFFFGGASIKFFILALIVGIASGTYSSIFIASPLLVMFEKWNKK